MAPSVASRWAFPHPMISSAAPAISHRVRPNFIGMTIPSFSLRHSATLLDAGLPRITDSTYSHLIHQVGGYGRSKNVLASCGPWLGSPTLRPVGEVARWRRGSQGFDRTSGLVPGPSDSRYWVWNRHNGRHDQAPSSECFSRRAGSRSRGALPR